MTLETFDISFNPTGNRPQIYDLEPWTFGKRAELVLLIGPAAG